MEQIDQSQAQRVWQRVRSQSTGNPPRQLEALITDLWEDASMYSQLARRADSRRSPILRRLGQQKQSQCACLRGIHAILTGKKLPLPRTLPLQGNWESHLRRCYERESRNLKELESRCADPEYSRVFQRLRDQTREHLCAVLELIGGLEN